MLVVCSFICQVDETANEKVPLVVYNTYLVSNIGLSKRFKKANKYYNEENDYLCKMRE